MVVVLVIALALTVYGALHDRTLNRRRAAEMLGASEEVEPLASGCGQHNGNARAR